MKPVPPQFCAPESRMPTYAPSTVDTELLAGIAAALRNGTFDAEQLDDCHARSSFPKRWYRLILVLYATGEKRILVSREGTQEGGGISGAVDALLRHPRRAALAAKPFRIQADFVVEPAVPVNLYTIGVEQRGERHFEPGIDGLMFKTADGPLNLFLPGDSYVRSIMGMRQLREYLYRGYGEDHIRAATFLRFRSVSYLSSRQGERWLRLYRGYPLVGPISREKVETAVEAAIDHIHLTQEADGRFLYYFDTTLDTRRDHEHPTRDPEKNPFYNILRHGGGALTCLFREKYRRKGDTDENVRKAIEFYLPLARTHEWEGRTAAYIYHEKKAKLGGTGVALYVLAEYELLTGDTRFREWADRFAWHLMHEITASGEFIYYHIYLDKFISEAENQNYFSFYYPGEAVCGLAKYLHLLTPTQRTPYFERLHNALDFLIRVRPATRADQYTAVPSDSWLMMGIKELWDFEAMRRPAYSAFVFSDARQMIDHLYKVTDAPYPDYAGAFYYEFGDYPYADGARCEGLLGAFELAKKMGERELADDFWQALKLAAWAIMHLTNTEDALYFAKNPALALGGIRFKYTRQWFRIDTIQHVASFYAKMLPHWEEEESRCAS